MNMDDDITFELSPWELLVEELGAFDTISAMQLLTALEGENEDTVEQAFQTLEDRCVTVSLDTFPKAAGTGEAALRLRQEEQLVCKNEWMQGLEPGDPLRLYLEELANIPAWGDAEILAREAAQDRENARTQLMNLSLARVVELAGTYTGYGVLLLDLIQEGSLGLWQGILRWSGDGDFASHRDWWIRQYMTKAVVLQARASGVGQKMRQALEDYRMADERLLGELGRNATLEEMAQALHMTPEEAAVVRNMLDSARLVGRAKASAEAEELPEEEEQATEDTAYFQQRQRILELLSGLSEDEARLLTLRFGLEGGLPLSPEETGKKLNLTADEVVAAEAAALAKLRRG